MASDIKVAILSFLSSRQGFPFVLGIIIGLMANLVTMPFFERACDVHSNGNGLPSIQQDHIHQYQPLIVTRNPDEIAQKVGHCIFYSFY